MVGRVGACVLTALFLTACAPPAADLEPTVTEISAALEVGTEVRYDAGLGAWAATTEECPEDVRTVLTGADWRRQAPDSAVLLHPERDVTARVLDDPGDIRADLPSRARAEVVDQLAADPGCAIIVLTAVLDETQRVTDAG